MHLQCFIYFVAPLPSLPSVRNPPPHLSWCAITNASASTFLFSTRAALTVFIGGLPELTIKPFFLFLAAKQWYSALWINTLAAI